MIRVLIATVVLLGAAHAVDATPPRPLAALACETQAYPLLLQSRKIRDEVKTLRDQFAPVSMECKALGRSLEVQDKLISSLSKFDCQVSSAVLDGLKAEYTKTEHTKDRVCARVAY